MNYKRTKWTDEINEHSRKYYEMKYAIEWFPGKVFTQEELDIMSAIEKKTFFYADWFKDTDD